ncbi:MAG: hypothetical protein L3J31_00515 [Bacteroidales bacterium]|nr:hypothetical protein [Bacteroidales bacterium]MCF6341272.1 hypothetical protein [Bacteroidales bacterium]
MKTILNTFLMLAFISFAFSCGNPSAGTQSGNEDAGAHLINSENAVSLNNGKRWKANMATTIGINNMRELMGSFSEKDDIVAYATLKINLDNAFSSIVENCTMTGESHEQLHNYLAPLLEMMQDVGSSDLDTCQYGFMKLENHLNDYATYFE